MYFLDDNPHLLKQQLRDHCLIRSYQMDIENYQPDREDDEICDSVSECIHTLAYSNFTQIERNDGDTLLCHNYVVDQIYFRPLWMRSQNFINIFVVTKEMMLSFDNLNVI